MQILRVCNRKRVNFSKYKGCNHLSMFWVNFTIVIFSDICLPKFGKTQSNGKLQARTNPVMKKNQEKNPNTNVGVSILLIKSQKRKNDYLICWLCQFESVLPSEILFIICFQVNGWVVLSSLHVYHLHVWWLHQPSFILDHN